MILYFLFLTVIFHSALRINQLNQGGTNPGPRATFGPLQRYLWPTKEF